MSLPELFGSAASTPPSFGPGGLQPIITQACGTCQITTGPSAAWLLTNPPYHSHMVYPHADDRRFVDAVGFFTASGLDSEGSVILITTEVHRDAIRRYLKSDGNTKPLEANGQLCFFDAAAVMRTFMVDGDPDPRLFKEGIRALIEHVRYDEQGCVRDVRLFGEMVDLLWPENQAAAERVEALENEVLEEYSIPVLCGYSLDGPGRSSLPHSIINLHSHTITW